MYKKFFYQINELEAPREAVEKTVAAAKQAQQSGKVIEMKPKNNRKKLTVIGVIAASLAVVIALGAVFYPSAIKTAKTSNTDNSFFLVANAAEKPSKKITDKEFTAIGTVNPSGYGANYDNGQINERVDYFYFNINCRGKNIKTVTYSFSENSGIFIPNDAKNRLESFEHTNFFFKNVGIWKGDEPSEYYSSFTTSVDYQLKENDKAELAVYTKNRSDIASVLKNYLIFEESDEMVEIKDTATRDKFVGYLEAYYSTVLKDVNVTVSVQYDDETTEEKTLVFSPTVEAYKEPVSIEGGPFRDMWSFDITLNAKIA